MALLTLLYCQCDAGKKESVWLYTWILIVGIKILEFFVSQIGHAKREEPVPFGKTVPDCGIQEPEVMFTFFKGSCSRYWFKMALLLYVGSCTAGTQSRWEEKIDSQRDIVGFNLSGAIRKISVPFKLLP